jgi:hypothetical protein
LQSTDVQNIRIKANDLFDAADFTILMHVNIISGSNHYLRARNTSVFSVLIPWRWLQSFTTCLTHALVQLFSFGHQAFWNHSPITLTVWKVMKWMKEMEYTDKTKHSKLERICMLMPPHTSTQTCTQCCKWWKFTNKFDINIVKNEIYYFPQTFVVSD